MIPQIPYIEFDEETLKKGFKQFKKNTDGNLTRIYSVKIFRNEIEYRISLEEGNLSFRKRIHIHVHNPKKFIGCYDLVFTFLL